MTVDLKNPYSVEISEVKQTIQVMQLEAISWHNKLDYFGTLDIDDLTNELSQLSKKSTAIKKQLKELNDYIRNAKTTSEHSIKPSIPVIVKVRLPVSALLSSIKINRRKEEHPSASYIREVQSMFDSASKDLDAVREQELALKAKLSKAREFDRSLALTAVSTLNRSLCLASEKLEMLLEARSDWDKTRAPWVRRLGPMAYELDAMSTQLQELEKDLEYADRLNQSLSTTKDRKPIHVECEDKFGNGSPAQVIKTLTYRRGGLLRAIKKLSSRYSQLIILANIEIRHIIIDASNLCYQHNLETEKGFIGLAALNALVPALANYKITLVFDYSTMQRLRLSRDTLSSMFPSAVVHVTAEGSAADESLLQLACLDKHSVVISNDSYQEFEDLADLRKNRIISHEIYDDAVTISALDVKVKYSIQ